MSKADGRLAAADFLKAFAIIGVLLIHSSAAGFERPPGSFDWFASLFWGSVSRGAVPIFFMVSGALLLDEGYELSLKKLWTRKIARLAAAALFWVFAYQLRALLVSETGFSLPGLWQAVKLSLVARCEFHLYFLYIIILLYMLLPLSRLVAAKADRSTRLYLLAFWAVFGILYPSLRGVWPISLVTGRPTDYALNVTYSGLGYMLLGHELRQGAKRPGLWAGLAAVGFALIFGEVAISSLRAGTLEAGGFSGNRPGVALLAAGVCGWAFAFFRSRPAPRAARTLAGASFCVYLVHVFFLYALDSLFGLTATAGPCAVFVPLTALAMLACSLAVWALLRRIPLVKDWLI